MDSSKVNANSNTDPIVEGRLSQFPAVQGSHPEDTSTHDQSAVGSDDVGTDKPTSRRGGESSDLNSLYQPMGMVETGRGDNGYFSPSMDEGEVIVDFSCPMGSARSSSELITDSLDGVRFPSRVRTSMSDSTISSDCGRAADAEIESRHGGDGIESCEAEFSSRSADSEKIPGASQKEGLGDRLANDLAVPRDSAALPSDNAGSVECNEVVLPQATESVVDYNGGEKCPLYSDSVLTPDDSTERGAVPPSVIDNYAVAPPVPSL